MLERVGGAAVVALVTAYGVIEHGPLLGVAGGVCTALLVLLAPRLRTRVRVQRTSGEIMLARLSGPLTFMAQGQLMRLLSDPPWPRYVVLDMSAVSFVDGGGVSEVEHLLDFLEIRTAKVVVVGCRESVRQALVRAGIVERLAGGRIFHSVDGAMEKLAPTRRRHETPAPLAQAAGF